MAKARRVPNVLVGPYKQFVDGLHAKDERYRYYIGNQFVLEDETLVPQSRIDVWVCPNGRVFMVQVFPEGGFCQYLPPPGDKIDEAIESVHEYGKRKEEVPSA